MLTQRGNSPTIFVLHGDFGDTNTRNIENSSPRLRDMQKQPQMGSSFISIGSGWPSHLSFKSFFCQTEMTRKMAHPITRASSQYPPNPRPPPISSFAQLSSVLSLFAMSKVDQRNEVSLVVDSASVARHHAASVVARTGPFSTKLPVLSPTMVRRLSSSPRVPPPVTVVLSSCCHLHCCWQQRQRRATTNVSPLPSLDAADCNVFVTSASARIPHKCLPPLTAEDQRPDTAPSSCLHGRGCHCRSHQRIPH